MNESDFIDKYCILPDHVPDTLKELFVIQKKSSNTNKTTYSNNKPGFNSRFVNKPGFNSRFVL